MSLEYICILLIKGEIKSSNVSRPKYNNNIKTYEKNYRIFRYNIY